MLSNFAFNCNLRHYTKGKMEGSTSVYPLPLRGKLPSGAAAHRAATRTSARVRLRDGVENGGAHPAAQPSKGGSGQGLTLFSFQLNFKPSVASSPTSKLNDARNKLKLHAEVKLKSS